MTATVDNAGERGFLRSLERSLDLAYKAEQIELDERRSLRVSLSALLASQVALIAAAVAISSRIDPASQLQAGLLAGFGTWVGTGVVLITLAYGPRRVARNTKSRQACASTSR